MDSETSLSFNSSVSGLEIEDPPSDDLLPAAPPKKKRARGKPEFEVEELLCKRCCDKLCFRKIPYTTIEECRTKISLFPSETKQNQFFIDYMKDHVRKDKSILYTIAGEEVCEVCWRLSYGIRFNKFKSLKEKFTSGVVVLEHGHSGRLNTSESTMRLLEWMRSFFIKIGDHMPMSDNINLPSCLTRLDVYELAKFDLTQGGLPCPCPSSSYMYKIWQKEFPKVKIPKESRFSMCDVCAGIKEARERTLNPMIRKWLTEIMEEHVKLQKNEREKYTKHKRKAEKEPAKYISLIIDGMDQDKTNIPHLLSKPKMISGAYLLETHITGIRAHGRKTLMALDCNDFRHDSNLTIEIILRMLMLLRNSLSRTLYVQMDNTCRDNKNKYTLMFMFLMVEFGVFEKIKMGFLPVGHTHEDIDQLFSCISRKLKHSNVLTIPDLQKVIKGSFSPEPEVVQIEGVYDVKSWMMPCIPPLHDHLKAHQFKFQKKDGSTRMYYKEWSCDPIWLPKSGINMLTESCSVPSIELQPLINFPFYESDIIAKLQVTIQKISAYLEKSNSHSWWSSWLQNAQLHTSTTEPVHSKANWIFKALVQARNKTQLHNQSANLPAQSAQHSHDPGQVDPTVEEASSSTVFSISGNSVDNLHSKYTIPGIGVIPTSWVGEKGRESIFLNKSKEKEESVKVADLKKELQVLASMCLKAFDTIQNISPEIQTAVNLCQQYVPQPKKSRSASSVPLAELWNSSCGGSMSQRTEQEDKVELARGVLGDQIVSTIMEEHRDPPHIYIGSRRGKSRVLENRDILKELKVGMLVALQSKTEIPRIGIVSCIPPNPTLASQVSIKVYEQEKSSHKPKWLRNFNLTDKECSERISDFILYDFQLTKNGTIRKATREFIKKHLHS